MPAPMRLPLVDVEVLIELRRRYDATSNTQMRTRYQMILLAYRGHTVQEIARNRAVQSSYGYACAQPLPG
jgi:hypothetical protein